MRNKIIKIGIKTNKKNLINLLYNNSLKSIKLNQQIQQNKLIFEEISSSLQNKNNYNNYNAILADPNLIFQELDHNYLNIDWLQSTFAGVNLFLESKRNNYILTRIGEGFGPQMIEFVFGWILALQLNIPLSIEQKSKCEWNSEPFRFRGTIEGKTLGILGTGQIGSEIAQASKIFSLNTIGYCTNPSQYLSNSIKPFDKYTNSLQEIISKSDYLVNCLPSTPNTRYLLNSSLITSIRQSQSNSKSLVFLNIGRGDIISSHDILSLIHTGVFSHAVLDVFESEPLPSTHPFYSNEKIYTTPHISAISTPEIICQNMIKNLEVYVDVLDNYYQQNSNLQNNIQNEETTRKEIHEILKNKLFYVVDHKKGY